MNGFVISNGDLGVLTSAIFVETEADLLAAIVQFMSQTGTEFDHIIVNRVLPH